MSWFDTLPALAVGLVLLLVPGLMIAAALRVRGLDALGLAPVLSTAALMLGSILAPFLGLDWALWIPFASAFLLSGIAWVFYNLMAKTKLWDAPVSSQGGSSLEPMRWWQKQDLPYWASLVMGIGLLWRNITNSLGQPEWISQRWDNTFHLNAVRWIMDTGSASPLTLAGMSTTDGGSTFYPSAWHAYISLVVESTGSSIPVATNVMSLLAAAVVWPLSIIFLTRSILRLSMPAALASGPLAASFLMFPYIFMDWGILYPNLLGLVLLPLGLGLFAQLFRLVEVRRFATVQALSLLAWATFAIALGHPNAFVSLMVLTLPIVLIRCVSYLIFLIQSKRQTKKIALTLSVFLIYCVVFYVLWSKIRPLEEDGRVWNPVVLAPQALGEALALGLMGVEGQWVLSALVLIAVYSLACSHKLSQLWIFLGWVTLIALYVAGRSLPWEEGRYFWVGPWYSDTYRIAAPIPLITLPLVLLGIDYLIKGIQKLLGTIGQKPLILGLLSLLVAIPLAYYSQFSELMIKQVEYGFKSRLPYEPTAEILTGQEMTLLENLDRYVPEGEGLVVQPFNGSTLAYAYSGRHVSAYHTLGRVDKDVKYLQQNLNRAGQDPKVCSILDEKNLDYYLDFGQQEVGYGDHSADYPGFQNLAQSGVVREVYREGDQAVLYEITACSATVGN